MQGARDEETGRGGAIEEREEAFGDDHKYL